MYVFVCVIERERREACTVEPLNKGHCGNGHIVLFSEAVPILVACHFIPHLSIMFNDTRNAYKYIFDVCIMALDSTSTSLCHC